MTFEALENIFKTSPFHSDEILNMRALATSADEMDRRRVVHAAATRGAAFTQLMKLEQALGLPQR